MTAPRRRVVMVLVDGIADVSLPELGDLTPLEAARTPNLDAIAACGRNGLMDPVEPGMACGSDTAHLSLLGYPPQVYYKGRGAFESMGAGLRMEPGDIAFKSNFATMDDSTGIVTSRRADRHFEEEGPILCRHLDGIPIPGYPEVTVSVKYATEHRCGVVVRGPGLSCHVSGTDPLKDGRLLCTAEALDSTDAEAQHTARVVNAVSGAFRAALREHPVNRTRQERGANPANAVLLRGCGIRIEAPHFDTKHGLEGAAMVAPTKIIAGLGVSLGFDILLVPEATGDYRTCLSTKAAKMAAAVSAPVLGPPPSVLAPGEEDPQAGREKGYDFGFLHIKGIDDAGHDKAVALKLRGMEAVDQMIGQLARRLLDAEKTGLVSFVLCVTGDHSTPVLYGDHSFEPVPFAMCRLADLVTLKGVQYFNSIKLTKVMFPSGGSGEDTRSLGALSHPPASHHHVKGDSVKVFSESAAGCGCLGRFPGSEMMGVITRFLAE